MTKPWTDERIITAVSECLSSDREGIYLEYEEIENVVKRVRDDLQQRITELEAEITRLRAEVAKLPERPRPNWSQAPDWAMWWCVEPNGKVWWYEQEPIPFGYRWLIIGNPEPRRHSWNAIEIPIGVDWRQLIEQRP